MMQLSVLDQELPITIPVMNTNTPPTTTWKNRHVASEATTRL